MGCPTVYRCEVAEGNGTYSVCECNFSLSFKVNGTSFLGWTDFDLSSFLCPRCFLMLSVYKKLYGEK